MLARRSEEARAELLRVRQELSRVDDEVARLGHELEDSVGRQLAVREGGDLNSALRLCQLKEKEQLRTQETLFLRVLFADVAPAPPPPPPGAHPLAVHPPPASYAKEYFRDLLQTRGVPPRICAAPPSPPLARRPPPAAGRAPAQLRTEPFGRGTGPSPQDLDADTRRGAAAAAPQAHGSSRVPTSRPQCGQRLLRSVSLKSRSQGGLWPF